MWWLLHMPSIFTNGVYGFKKSEVSRRTFSKAWSWRKKRAGGFPCALPIMSPKRRYQPWLYGIWEVSEEAGWAEHASLLWSGALVAIQTQINRGGTLELMIEEGGGGVSGGGLSSPEPRSPEKWRTGAHYAHFQPQLRTGPTLPLSLLQTSSPSFHNFSQLVTSVQRSETSQSTAWLHESFMDLEVGKLLAALYWSSSPLVTVDYWHNAGPLAAIYWGKILFGRVYVRLLQEGNQQHSAHLL